MANLSKVPPPPALSVVDGPHSADLSAAGQDALAPQVAVAPDGTATVVWSAQAGGAFAVYMRRADPDGTLGVTQELSATGRDAGEPQVAIAPDGVASVVWKRFNGAQFLIKERR